MKKLITLCLFVFTLLLGTQGLMAQNSKEINAMASDKVLEMQKTIKLNKNQLEDIYQAYIKFQTNYVKISEDLQKNQEVLKKINTVLDTRLKEILSAEQFERYLSIYRTNQ